MMRRRGGGLRRSDDGARAAVDRDAPRTGDARRPTPQRRQQPRVEPEGTGRQRRDRHRRIREGAQTADQRNAGKDARVQDAAQAPRARIPEGRTDARILQPDVGNGAPAVCSLERRKEVMRVLMLFVYQSSCIPLRRDTPFVSMEERRDLCTGDRTASLSFLSPLVISHETTVKGNCRRGSHTVRPLSS